VSQPDPIVLIVDDNDMNRKLAGDVLRLAGFQTLEAASAAEGIASATAHLPDVILMDLRLPDLDGSQAALRLRSDPRTARIPIVGLSSLRIDDGEEWLQAMGFAGYLTKPVDTDELPDLVRRFCAINDAARQ
jgi:two-component system cell cycle response regulator DivK